MKSTLVSVLDGINGSAEEHTKAARVEQARACWQEHADFACSLSFFYSGQQPALGTHDHDALVMSLATVVLPYRIGTSEPFS